MTIALAYTETVFFTTYTINSLQLNYSHFIPNKNSKHSKFRSQREWLNSNCTRWEHITKLSWRNDTIHQNIGFPFTGAANVLKKCFHSLTIIIVTFNSNTSSMTSYINNNRRIINLLSSTYHLLLSVAWLQICQAPSRPSPLLHHPPLPMPER